MASRLQAEIQRINDLCRARGFEARWDIIDAIDRYLEGGLTGPCPDRDMTLLPDSMRKMAKSGFTEHLWTPSVEEKR